MGEIADSMVIGECCSLCGCYFQAPEEDVIYEHGYPVYCKDCWEPGCGHSRALVDTF